MADSALINVRTTFDGFRRCDVKATLVSDGSGLAGYTVYDATSANVNGNGGHGVLAKGQTFYPGLHTVLVGLDYDVQDMKVRIQWHATANEDILAMGNAPEDFWWGNSSGFRVPAGLAGATGSIDLTTVGQVPNATFTIVLKLWKGFRY